MKRRQLLVGAGTATAAAFAGCLGSAQQANSEAAANDPVRTITVSESGEIDTDPDLAVIQAGVEATGDDPTAVRDDLATRIDTLHDELVAYGIPDENITSGRFRIRDRIDERRLEEDEVDPRTAENLDEYIYYEGSHSLTVEVEDVDETGTVVDVAIDAGADSIGRIEFTLSDEKRTELREEALEDAIGQAHAEAEFIADEVDATVIEAVTVDTTGGSVSPVRESLDLETYAAADDASPSTTFHPDDVTVSASVTITYEIE